MSSPTATPVKSTRRAVGQLRVGDYVGQPAADAAQAVRRAGLRPALERCLEISAEPAGTVFAQDPPAGGELARNAMVTLHVAAPAASAARNRPAEAGPLAGQLTLDGTGPPVPAADGEAAVLQAPQSAPPEPAITTVLQPELPWESETPDVAYESVTVPSTPHEPSTEELTSRLAAVLSGDGEPTGPRRRAYPRHLSAAPLDGLRSWLASHRPLSLTVGAALAFWVFVAVHGGGTGVTSRTSLMAGASRVAQTVNERASARPVRAHTSRSRGGRAVPHQRTRPRKRVRRVSAAAAGRPRSEKPASTDTAAPTPPSVPSTTTTPAQTSGGPFSP